MEVHRTDSLSRGGLPWCSLSPLPSPSACCRISNRPLTAGSEPESESLNDLRWMYGVISCIRGHWRQRVGFSRTSNILKRAPKNKENKATTPSNLFNQLWGKKETCPTSLIMSGLGNNAIWLFILYSRGTQLRAPCYMRMHSMRCFINFNMAAFPFLHMPELCILAQGKADPAANNGKQHIEERTLNANALNGCLKRWQLEKVSKNGILFYFFNKRNVWITTLTQVCAFVGV